ncbi:putative nuclease HARBI1-like protein [Leptotrombidium deliense]|uniref:Putative nuclease HARBI1 n=1 Tax=Leptotrombidium deliense TaxID=299467 RepID=A0A443RYN5_9ACAR|nr:putative nuclease HARBI1-like protein [Leptotrombidium deliense]
MDDIELCEYLEHRDRHSISRLISNNQNFFRQLLALIEKDIRICEWKSSTITAEQQLLVVLRFHATGSVQKVQGDMIGFSQPTISRVVSRVSEVLAKLAGEYIVFPPAEEWNEKLFYDIASFPGVIGAIDGTHIEVQVPKAVQERFRNRKNRITLNVQAVVDAKMKFTNLVVRWPGSVHDSRIFRNSALYDFLETNNINGHLLGDAGYACKNYMMTPLANPTSPAEKRYQISHTKTRNVIERTFGAWKAKFYCLHIPLRISLKNTLNVIVACGVLWNFLINIGDEITENSFACDLPEDVNEAELNQSANNDNRGTAKRCLLIDRYFQEIQ